MTTSRRRLGWVPAVLVIAVVTQGCGSSPPVTPPASTPTVPQGSAGPSSTKAAVSSTAPAASDTPQPAATPEPSAAPTSSIPARSSASPEPSAEPSASPELSAEPSASPELSAEPSAGPEPSAQPGGPLPGPPSSDQLITGALSRGEITAEQATIYRAFLNFDDPRLPDQFRGNDTGHDDARAWWLDYASLSPEGQALLKPFLLRPDVDGSWYYTTPGAETASGSSVALANYVAVAARPPGAWLNVTGPRIRVLYTQERLADRARQVLAEAEGVVWPALLGLLGQAPPADCVFLCGDKGGTPQYDIYLVDKSGAFRSYSQPEGPCSEVSSFVVLNQREEFDTLAHELMHAFQNSFKRTGAACTEWRWFDEATAQWAIDYVYKRRYNLREQVADWYLDNPTISLNFKDDSREYGAYVFFFFLTRVASSPSNIRAILTKAASEPDSLKAIDAVIPGGFTKQFPDFAKYSWNPSWTPLNQYRIIDDLTDRAQPLAGPEELAGPNRLVTLFNSKVNYLSSAYFHYEVLDPDVRTIMFVNGYTYKLTEEDVGGGFRSYVTRDLGASAPARKYGKVIALVKREGRTDWDIEDWTNQASAFFCQDDPKAARLEEVVVILTNSNPDRRSDPIVPQGLKPGFWISNEGCYQWKGTATFKNEDHTWTITTAVTWQRVGLERQGPGSGGGGPSGAVGLGLSYAPIAGTMLWEASGTDSSGCTHRGQFSYTFAPRSVYPATIMTTFNFVPSGTYLSAYTAFGIYLGTVKETVSCRSGSTKSDVPLPQWIVAAIPPGKLPIVQANGRLMDGINGKPAKAYWEWHFTAVSAP